MSSHVNSFFPQNLFELSAIEEANMRAAQGMERKGQGFTLVRQARVPLWPHHTASENHSVLNLGILPLGIDGETTELPRLLTLLITTAS